MKPLPQWPLSQVRAYLAKTDDLSDEGLFIRWARRRPRPGERSVNHQTGQAEAGLSSERLWAELDDEALIEQIMQYRYLGGIPYLMTGREVGRGSDGEPVIVGRPVAIFLGGARWLALHRAREAKMTKGERDEAPIRPG